VIETCSGRSRWLVIAPGDPVIARRPFARGGLDYTLSPAAVTSAVAAAHRCPFGIAYSGPPYLAFLANRQMPGNQPDQFIIRYAAIDAPFARRATLDTPRCPS
jgi:hypothetical protein